MNIITFDDYIDIIKNGVYLGVRPDEQSYQHLQIILNDVLGRLNAEPHDAFHVTVIYSKGRGIIPHLSTFAFYDTEIIGFDLFGDYISVLVM